MNTLATFTALLLVGLAATAPVNDDVLHIDDDMFPEEFIIYTGENEITKIVVPLNSINFEDEPEDEDALNSATDDIYVFFIEDKKGLFVYKNKTATKLLNNGKDIAASADESKQVYLAATDGIYTFNAKTKSAEKYGTLTDNIINIAVVNGTGEIYILTKDHVVYKVTENGNNKEEIANIKDAQQIVLDSLNNLYYVDSNKRVHIRLYEDGTVKDIKGLPEHSSSVQLLRPPIVLEESVPVVVGKKAYFAYANGTVEFADVVLDTKPTAYSLEASLLVYAGHNNKIYEYNLLNIIVLGIIQEGLEGLSDVKTFFEDKTSEIESIATRSMKSIRT